jgi:hypothetical protein
MPYIAVLFLCSGCAWTAHVTFLNPGIEPARERFYGTVKIFAHRDIGIEVVELGSVSIAIHAEAPGARYISMIQKEAAKIGADAVVDYHQQGTTATGIAVRFVKKK